jgi:SAM-dependent methyltransferase
MFKTITLPNNLEYETITTCDLCGSENIIYWDSARSNTLSKCKDCGLVFTNPRIADSKVKDRLLYSKAYFQQKSRMTEKLINARKTSYHREIQKLSKYLSHGRILDVGCGMGTFLDHFSSGWEKHGCDVSSYALQEAEKWDCRVSRGV